MFLVIILIVNDFIEKDLIMKEYFIVLSFYSTFVLVFENELSRI